MAVAGERARAAMDGGRAGEEAPGPTPGDARQGPTPRIVAISNQKGGSGKSTIALNLAQVLARRGQRTLVIDNDSQANLTSSLVGADAPAEIAGDPLGAGTANTLRLYRGECETRPLNVAPNLDLIGATARLDTVEREEHGVAWDARDAIDELAGNYEHVLIDCQPGLNTKLQAALLVAGHVLVPTQLAQYSVEGIDTLLEHLFKVRRRQNPELQLLGLVRSQVNSPALRVERHFDAELTERYGEGRIFDTVVYRSTRYPEAQAAMIALADYRPAARQAAVMEALADEYLARVAIRMPPA